MEIRNTYTIAAKVDQVFAAWISESHLVAPVTAVEVEPRVGGTFRLHADDGNTAAIMTGEFQAFDSPHHLRYTWHWGGPDEPSIVDVQFSAVDGRTVVDLHHSGLASESMVADHENGWGNYIRGLQELLS